MEDLVSDLTCRSCRGTSFAPVLSLGRTPLANSLLREEDLTAVEETFPLDVVYCRTCTLVQLTLSVPPERIFREYAYFSSVSDALVSHAEALTRRIIRDRRLDHQHLVIEIASNDGYLLQHYRTADVPVLGIEPARNIARAARARGIETIDEFFSPELARTLRASGRLANVIHANNVLAHVPDLRGVAKGIHTLLAPGGLAIVEVPYVCDLIDQCEFDTIYHEHLCYFSLAALNRLFTDAGLTIVDVERLEIHGGSLRIFAGRTEDHPVEAPSVRTLTHHERRWGVDRETTYAAFGKAVDVIRHDLVEVIDRVRAQGKRVAAYGASAKGATLLNASGIGHDRIEFIADRSPHKQGRYVPGARIPIVDASALAERAPDYAVLLAWNFADEIFRQQAEYRRRGGTFIIPVPRVEMR